MTDERYDAPNHPRWDPRTNGRPNDHPEARRRYGRTAPSGDGRRRRRTPHPGRSGDAPRSDPPLLLAREATGDDATVELRATSDRVCVAAELPDRSLDDVRVSVDGASIRIRADPRDSQSATPGTGLDRTITLAETVRPADVVVAYHDPVLAVVVPR